MLCYLVSCMAINMIIYDTMHYGGSIICMIPLYDTPHYKAGHGGGIIADIMHSEIASMLMWQRIKYREG